MFDCDSIIDSERRFNITTHHYRIFARALQCKDHLESQTHSLKAGYVSWS